MDERSMSFQLLMGRLGNQDEALARIETKLDAVNGKVQKHEVDIQSAKRLGWFGITITPIALGLWRWWGGK